MRKSLLLLLGLGVSLPAISQVTSTSTYPIGPNLALNKPATASSSEGANYQPKFAFDANYGSRWASDRSNPATIDTQWLAVNLGATYTITKVRVNWEAAYGKDYQIQVSSDGTTWTPVRTVTGNTASVNLLSGLAASGQYVRLYNTARGTGYGYSVYELEVSASNAAPTVQLTQPAANSTYTGTINLSADATDNDGAVSKVDFYVDNVLVGSDNTPPYAAAWPTASTGTHVAKAVATDDNGATATSYERTFYTSNPSPNAPPVVELTSPQAADYPRPSAITLTASAADPDGTVAQVAFYANGTLLYTATASPYTYTWTATVAGVYDLTAVATDNSGASTTSVARRVQVVSNPPVVSLVTPVDQGTYTGPNIPIVVNATDPDGTVAKVEIYSADFSSTLLATLTASPYTYTWTGVAPGSHTIFVRATDNSGRTTGVYSTFTVLDASAKAVPGRVEAESYDAAQGIQTEPTADTGGGLNVGYIDTGDYLDYKLTSAANDYYTVQFRVASWIDGAQLQLQQPVGLEGIATLATVTLPNTGGGQVWQTVTVSNVVLPVGSLTLRVKALSNGFNFNWMAFSRQNGQQTNARAALAARPADAATKATSVQAYPNPSTGLVHLAGVAEGTAATVVDQVGRTVLTSVVRNGTLDLSSLRAGSYFVSLPAAGNLVKLPLLKQ